MAAELSDWLRRAHDSLRKGDLGDAHSFCDQVLQIAPRNGEALTLSGLCFQAQGRHREAIERFERAGGQDPRIYRSLGISLQILGQVSKAAQCFLKAIELEPEVAGNYSCLGKLMLSRGHFPNAVDCGREAVRIEPGSAANHVFLAQALVRMGAGAEAEAEFRQAAELEPNVGQFARMLGFHLLASGKSETAGECLEKSIQLQPKQGLAYLGLVQRQKITSTGRGLIERIERVLQIEGLKREDRKFLHYALGKGYDDLADYETAIGHYEEANRLAFEDRQSREPYNLNGAEERPNQAARLFTPETMDAHRSGGADTTLPIFIVGMMRSGTTLVDQILSSHPEVGAAGEVPLWITDGPNALNYAAVTLSPTVLKGLSEQYLELLGRISPGTSRVTDKMPANYQMLGAINLAFPQARIIHVKRNSADTCLSIYTTPYGVSPSFAHRKENIVAAYKHYLRMMELWRKVLPKGSMLEVEYEGLVRDRERVTREMVQFCGLNWNDACLAPERNARLVSTPSIAQVRQPVYQSSIDRWKLYEPWLGPIKDLLKEEQAGL